MCAVGFGYRNGRGVERDLEEALRYYRRASDQGCPTGAYWIGYAYEHGEGVARDLESARRWYRLSRDRGDGDAAEALSRLGDEARPRGGL